MKRKLDSSYRLSISILTLLITFGISSPLYAETIIYDYDDLHRLKKTVYPSGDVEEYTYDAVQ